METDDGIQATTTKDKYTLKHERTTQTSTVRLPSALSDSYMLVRPLPLIQFLCSWEECFTAIPAIASLRLARWLWYAIALKAANHGVSPGHSVSVLQLLPGRHSQTIFLLRWDRPCSCASQRAWCQLNDLNRLIFSIYTMICTKNINITKKYWWKMCSILCPLFHHYIFVIIYIQFGCNIFFLKSGQIWGR